VESVFIIFNKSIMNPNSE